MKEPRENLVLSQFSKIFNSPEVLQAIGESWLEISKQKKGQPTLQQQKDLMVKCVTRLYGLVNDPCFSNIQPVDSGDKIYVSRTTYGQKYSMRMVELKNCLTQNNQAVLPIQSQEAIVFQEDYTPFNVDEMYEVTQVMGLDK